MSKKIKNLTDEIQVLQVKKNELEEKSACWQMAMKKQFDFISKLQNELFLIGMQEHQIHEIKRKANKEKKLGQGSGKTKRKENIESNQGHLSGKMSYL